jgi:ferredoxin-NADP reductase
MEEHIVKIISIDQVTHDVKRFRFEKPQGYSFVPGQATDVSINSALLKNEKRPFTFTCLNSDPFLEFTIKIYNYRNGVTKALGDLKPGDELIIRDVWGAISYKGEGVFIAGGAGITPFISILRDLRFKNEIKGNILLFANKTRSDIILENELRTLLGPAFKNILSEELVEGYAYGMINKEFIKRAVPDLNTNYYVCGPPPMLDSVLSQLADLGIRNDLVTIEL